MRAGEQRLEGIINPQIREVLGSDGVTSNTILSDERSGLMDQITVQAQERAASLGLEVLDVRLKQTNLPIQKPRGDLRPDARRAGAGSRRRGRPR